MMIDNPVVTRSSHCNFGSVVFVASCLCISLFLYGSNKNHASSLFVKENTSPSISTDSAMKTLWIQNAKCSRHRQTRSVVSQSKQNVLNDWSVAHYPLFFSTMDIPISSWDSQKAKFVRLLLDTEYFHQNNLSFVVGFSGSSVTAAHDNFFHESYPNVFFNAMMPAMRAVLQKEGDKETDAIPFVVRNHALGNNPCYAYDACIATHLGEDLDILTWEQSMNCGRNSKYVDTFTRAAYRMHKKPTVMFLLSGGPTWTPQDCHKLLNSTSTNDTIPRKTPLTLAERALLHTPLRQVTGNNPLMRDMAFLRDPDGDLLQQRFSSLGPMAQSTFPLEAYRCLGPYSQNFSVKSPGGGAAWHPGRLGHKLRGDSLAFFLLSVLEDAVLSVSQVACSENEEEEHTTHETLSVETIKKLAMTAIRHLNYSTGDEQQFASLQTSVVNSVVSATTSSRDEAPSKQAIAATTLLAYSQAYLDLLQSVPPPAVPASYRTEETNFAPTCFTSFEPRQSHDLSQQMESRFSNWTLQLSPFDRDAVLRNDKRHMGYLDRKYIHMSTGPGSVLALRISSVGTNVL